MPLLAGTMIVPMIQFDPGRHLPVRVLAIAGSLRRRSFNAALIRAAAEMAPACLEMDVYEELSTMPHYNEDVRSAGEPPPVRSEEHTSELQSLTNLVCRLLLEKKK